jgi:hypothetical protein|tara:strand:- start:260 stop:718 length:459 start_codon:yes stop_codon:yes gene_type:complete
MNDINLNQDQRNTLKRFLNIIIPPCEKSGLVGAGELNLMEFVIKYDSNALEIIIHDLDIMNKLSIKKYSKLFALLSEKECSNIFEDLKSNNNNFAKVLIVNTLGCYYQNDSILKTLGISSKAPFPDGNQVISGDLNLLDPVRKMSSIYRDIY